MIEARSLSKRYGDLVAIDDVTFTMTRGNIVGFLGPNGAGKTTTMRILAGTLRPSSGSTRIMGFDMAKQPLLAKQKLGYLPERPPLDPDLTVSEYLYFVARLKGITGADLKISVGTVMGQMGLNKVAKRLLRNVSKGFQQRTGLAQALLADPAVLILDEPTVGLDPRQISEVRDLIGRIAHRRTVIVSTHLLQEVTAICHRVLIMHQGKIVTDAALDDLVDRFPNTMGQQQSTPLERAFIEATATP